MSAIKSISVKGTGSSNEDAVVCNSSLSLYGVLDGVSSLISYVSNDLRKGGEIASTLVKEHFEQLTSLTDLLTEVEIANRKLRDAMEEAQIDLSQKEALWGTAVALARISDDFIEFVQTGDCMIFTENVDGTIRVLTYPQVAHLENIAFEQWEKGITQGFRLRSELIEIVRERLKQNRYLSNTKGGYGVLNGEEDATKFLDYGKISKNNVRRLILVTDGLFLPATDYRESPDWGKMVEYMLSQGLDAYTAHVLDIEENDPECLKYIRFKKSDDKTGVIINLDEC